MDRRRFVGSAALVALGPFANALLSGCARRTPDPGAAALQALSSHTAQTLFGVSRALLPHAAAPDGPYGDVVTTLDRLAAADDGVAQRLASAVAELDAAAAGDWSAADAEAKVAALESLQDRPWFDLLLQTSITTVYRHPDIWALLGYEGASLEFGGYLHRGFDDIDWLPEQGAEDAR